VSPGNRKTLLVGVALAFGGAASAQDGGPGAPPVDAPAGEGDPATGTLGVGGVPLPAPAPRPLAVDQRWEPTGLSRAVRGLAVTRADTVVAVDAEGGLHRQAPGGGWVLVLPPPLGAAEEIDDEDLLLEAEATIAEGAETVTGTTAFEGEGASSFSVDEGAIDDTLAQGAQFAEQVAESAETAGAGRAWASARVDGLVLASRPDGVWRSADDGRTWRLVADLPPIFDAIEPLSGPAAIVVGTAGGLRTSLDGGLSFVSVDDALADLVVHALGSDAGGLLAGTSAGLYRSADGLRWRPVPTAGLAGQEVRALAVDPSWEGGLWLATPDAVLRSDDGGLTARQPALNPLAGTARLVVLPEPGHLLAAGDDGVWESIDGGVRWVPLVDGLGDPQVHSLRRGPRGLLLAGDRVVYRLGPRTADDGAQAGTAPVGPPLGDVLTVALRRSGVAMEPLLITRTISRVGLIPVLRLGAAFDRDQNLAADWTRGRTTYNDARSWTLTGELCFGGCVDLYSTYDFDGSVDYDSGITDAASLEELRADEGAELDYTDLVDVDVYVIEGQVYSYAEAGSFAPAAANVAERLARHRTQVSAVVADLYLSRLRLIESQAQSGGLPLREQVALAVEIAELTARLDVYTDGYFSSAIHGS
jgi:hypothetical protein